MGTNEGRCDLVSEKGFFVLTDKIHFINDD